MVAAYGGAVFSGWIALRSSPCWIAAALFGLTATALSVLTLRPPIEIHETYLAIGRLEIPWDEIERVDQTGWNAPLAVYLTLRAGHRIMLLYPGDAESSRELLIRIRRGARNALIDGIPFSQFWGSSPFQIESSPDPDTEREVSTEPAKRSQDSHAGAPTRYPLLRAEDEEEVERLFQRLKSVGHLESKNSDEK
jgi:hypothetical protein